MAAIAPAASIRKRAASLDPHRRAVPSSTTRARPTGGRRRAARAAGTRRPHIKPVMAYPDINEPMYRPLSEIVDDLLVPNLGLIPPNCVSLMLTNPPFIEAYMAGAEPRIRARAAVAGISDRLPRLAVPSVLGCSRVPTPGTDGKARAALSRTSRSCTNGPSRTGSARTPIKAQSGRRDRRARFARRSAQALSQHDHLCAARALERQGRARE